MFSRNKIAAVGAEFLGTAILAFTFLSVSRSTIGIPYFVAIAAGLAIVLMGLTLARDVQLNPAYTIALWTGRRVPTVQAVLFIAAQMLGAWAAYWLYKYFAHGTIQHIPGTYDARVLVAEAVGTLVFAFTAAGMIYQKAHWMVRAVVTGSAYILGVIVASVASAGFINPAVALASNAWGWTTYALGPVLGAILGVNLYALLYAPAGEKGSLAKVVAKAKPAATSAKKKK